MGDRVILHSDINCCYASIEHLHHPELAGKPLAVGGDPEARHGIVLTADYIAKKYGVKTGMALWQAKQVCPDITFVSPRMDLYLRFSRMAHEIYAEYTDRQEPYGIDECWLDVTGSSSLKGDGLLIAQEISRRMKSELGITVSVGVSFNKIFAKLGSDYKKPDAITTMYKSEFKQKAWSLPVADLLYVGKSTNRKLALFGLHKKAKNEIVPNEATLNILKNEEHVKWAKNSADKAVTLVKDTAGILPLSPRKTKKVLLEIMGDFPSNERVLESFRTKLSDEGFEVTVYEHENFETARFDVETFKKSYDLVIYIGNVENASNKVTNRLSWYTFWGNGNNVPWFVAERPVVFISLANPYHLVDVPMIKTYINGYSNSEYVIESVMDKLMGRSSFTGKSPVNPFCGKEYLKW